MDEVNALKYREALALARRAVDGGLEKGERVEFAIGSGEVKAYRFVGFHLVDSFYIFRYYRFDIARKMGSPEWRGENIIRMMIAKLARIVQDETPHSAKWEGDEMMVLYRFGSR